MSVSEAQQIHLQKKTTSKQRWIFRCDCLRQVMSLSLVLICAASLQACMTQSQGPNTPDADLRFLGDPAPKRNESLGQTTGAIGRASDDRPRSSYVEFANFSETDRGTKKPFLINNDGQDVSLNFVDV